MKCPKCGGELRRSASEPNMGLCDRCMMKFDWVEPVKPCKKCKQMIPINSQICPFCGKSQHAKTSTAIIVLIIVVIIILFLGLLPSGQTDNVSSSDSPTEVQEDITIGSSFTVNDLKITINEADTNFTEYSDEYGLYAPEEGMKYLMVSFTFENVGDSGDRYVSIYDFDCFADDANCDQKYLDDGSDFMNANLSPGRNVSFKAYYSIPTDAQKIELEYKESIIGDERTLIKIQ